MMTSSMRLLTGSAKESCSSCHKTCLQRHQSLFTAAKISVAKSLLSAAKITDPVLEKIVNCSIMVDDAIVTDSIVIDAVLVVAIVRVAH